MLRVHVFISFGILNSLMSAFCVRIIGIEVDLFCVMLLARCYITVPFLHHAPFP